LRDSILDLRVNQETQQQGRLNAFLGSAQQIQALFNETSGTGLRVRSPRFSAACRSFPRIRAIECSPGCAERGAESGQAFNQSSSNLVTLQRNVDCLCRNP